MDRYTLTPSELFFLGKAQDDAAQKLSGEARQAALALAAEHFDRLLTDWQKPDYQLRDDVAKEVVRRMLFLAIERGDSKAVVRFFEAVKERYADLVVPFDKILVVGKSYLDLGEFESALLVFRGTAEASFLKDAGVATTLEGLGEIKASANFLDRLLMAYPDLPTMRVARYSIGQNLRRWRRRWILHCQSTRRLARPRICAPVPLPLSASFWCCIPKTRWPRKCPLRG